MLFLFNLFYRVIWYWFRCSYILYCILFCISVGGGGSSMGRVESVNLIIDG
jgi:hypothetical protein